MNMHNINKGRKPLDLLWLQRPEALPLLLSLAIYFVFSALVLNHALFFTMDADEAFNATIAKNWVAGYGYSSSLGLIFPFDAYISSGPAYTFLQAIPIWISGNDPDAQKPFIAIVHLVLFANFLYLVRPVIPSAWRFFLFLSFSLSAYTLLDFKFWHRPAGELLSLLYFLNGALLLWRAVSLERYLLALGAGFFLALACLTKGQALLWVGGLLVGVSIFYSRRPSLRLTGLLLICAAIFLFPLSAWHWYKHSVMAEMAKADPIHYEYAIGKDWHFFTTHGSGLYLMWEVESWQDLWRRFSSTPLLALKKLQEIFRDYGALSGVLSVLLPIMLIGILSGALRKNRDWQLFLIFPLISFWAWAFFLNNSVYPHQLLPGVWFLVLFIGLLCIRWPLLLFSLTFVNAVLFIQHGIRNQFSDCLLMRDSACIYTTANPIRQSLVNVTQYLQSANLPAPMANCGWYFSQDIEFSLPDVNNIQDCMRLFDKAVVFDRDAFIRFNNLPEHFRESRTTDQLISIYVNKRKNLFGNSFVAPVTWSKPLEFTFVASIYTMGPSLEQKRNVMSFLDHCQQVLYKDEYYSVQHCSFENLQEYVKSWGGLPIFTHDWEAHYYSDFMYTTKVLRKNPVHMRPY